VGQTYHNLQALRGAACLAVIWLHLWHWERDYGVSTPLFEHVRWFGTAGVDVFFALSGFLMAYTQAGRAGRARAVPGFVFRRLWRVLPAYWVVLSVSAVALWAVMGKPLFEPDWRLDWLCWVTLQPGGPTNVYVGPAWTLTYEMAFYLTFGATLALPLRVGTAALMIWAAVILAALPAYPLANPYLRLAVSPLLLEMIAGAFVAALVRKGYTGGGRTAVAVGLIYGIAAVALARLSLGREWLAELGRQPLRIALYGPPAVLLVYGLAAMEARGRLLAPDWLRRTGDASYSLYLVHGPVYPFAVAYGCYLPHARLPHLGWLAATLAVCVAGGFLLHHAVERPLLRLVRRAA
jgi:peptidoglycan/LPS O-acetylase OafA/YrhL